MPAVATTRNFSRINSNLDNFDQVQSHDGTSYTVPARIGSTYWAILKLFYENPNTPIYIDDLLAKVDEIMADYDPDSWDAYKSKQTAVVIDKQTLERSVKPMKGWQHRIITNTKIMTRNKDYGLRLKERGHCMKMEYDAQGKPYFKLYVSNHE